MVTVNALGRVQELCESRRGRPWAPVPNKPMVFVDVKQHFDMLWARAQELCESRRGRPWAPVPNKPMVFVDVKQHFDMLWARAQELCESRGGRPGLPSLISLRFLWT